MIGHASPLMIGHASPLTSLAWVVTPGRVVGPDHLVQRVRRPWPTSRHPTANPDSPGSGTARASPPARTSYRGRPITVTEPKILPMLEQVRAQAVAVVARWFAELFNDDDFRAKVEDQAHKNDRAAETEYFRRPKRTSIITVPPAG